MDWKIQYLIITDISTAEIEKYNNLQEYNTES